MTTPENEDAVDALVEQAESLCTVHDHITRVIADLDVVQEEFSDQYRSSSTTDLVFESVVRMFIYQHARGFNDSELYRRLKGTAYVFLRFDLDRAPTQQAINYMWRRRFSLADRQAITATAREIRAVAAEHDITSDGEPRLDPEEVGDAGVTDDQIMDAIRVARDRGLDAFETDRAANATYPDEIFFERQSYLNMANVGTTTPQRRFDRLSNWKKTPHGDTHLRTMKKISAPPEQTTLADFADGARPPDWERIRDAILDPFHTGLECLLDEVIANDGLREPVVAAIDITHWDFHPSPYKGEDEEDKHEQDRLQEQEYTRGHDPDHGQVRDRPRDLGAQEPVADDADLDEVVIVNGEEKTPKEEYPVMVSGDPEGYSYKFATLTVVDRNTPIVLAIEPVREASVWETDADESYSKAALVERLLEQAEQHVEIHKLFADRGFDSQEIRDVIDRRDITYVIPKKEYSAEREAIENVQAQPVADVAVERPVALSVNGRSHEVSFIYVPSTEEDGQYAIFTTNRDVSPDRAMAVTAQYRQRWEIENEYKTIKHNFLPTTASTDYRIRLLYFTLGVVMYNVWRLTNLLLREALTADLDLGATPPLRAGEVVELIGFCLAPGG